MRGCRNRPCLLSGAGGPCVLGLSGILARARLRLGLHGCNLPAKTISPPLRVFLAQQSLFAARFSTAFGPQPIQPPHPPPAASQRRRNGATLLHPNADTSWLTTAPSPQRKTHTPARIAPSRT